MGKKSKSKSSGIVHKEAFQRMSFLYQVCVIMTPSALQLEVFFFCSFLQAAHSVLCSNPCQPQLSRFYIHTLKAISKRLVLKMYVVFVVAPSRGMVWDFSLPKQRRMKVW